MDIQETLTRQLPLYARVLVKKGSASRRTRSW